MVTVSKRVVRFGFDEIRQYLVIAPAGIAETGLMIIIVAVAADIDHIVDCTRAAERLALRHKNTPVSHDRLRLSPVAPIIRAILQLGEPRRRMNGRRRARSYDNVIHNRSGHRAHR
jgi:hypothetical protein